MSTARNDIIGGIRRSLGRGPVAGEVTVALRQRLAAHARNIVPQRGQLPPREQRALFVRFAEEAAATVTVVPSRAAVPQAVAEYLASQNLPSEVVMSPDPALDAIPWGERPLLTIRRDRAKPDDAVGVTPVFAAIAESGTLMLTSAPERPTTLNLLPETHVAVVSADQVVGAYEDAWDRLRRVHGEGPAGMPRTVNFITGPSRSADIEQTLQMGAHGPRRLHIILIDDGDEAAAG